MNEKNLMNLFHLKASKAMRDVTLFRRNIGQARMPDGRVVRFGQPGQSDIWGVRRGGLHFEIECKAAGGRLSTEQKRWRDWCGDWSVLYLTLEARKGESPEQTVERWLGELAMALAYFDEAAK